MKYTPGPWKISPDVPSIVYALEDGGQVADTCGETGRWFDTSPWRTQPERFANARLIALAPEMLSVLKECDRLLNHTGLSSIAGAMLIPTTGAAVRQILQMLEETKQ